MKDRALPVQTWKFDNQEAIGIRNVRLEFMGLMFWRPPSMRHCGSEISSLRGYRGSDGFFIVHHTSNGTHIDHTQTHANLMEQIQDRLQLLMLL